MVDVPAAVASMRRFLVEQLEGTFEMPEECPVCGGTVVSEGPIHYCTNASCPARLERTVEHFCSKEAMDVEGLVSSVADLYDLTVEDLVALDGFGERSAETLVEEVEATKVVDLASFVYALGIRRVGAERARRLADEFSLADLHEADAEELREVEDVGPEVAASVESFFENERNRALVDRLLDAGVTPERAERGSELAGTTFVITGRIEGYTREELRELLERHGADVSSSVSDRTDYLVVGADPGETKREVAEEHDVDRMDAETFRQTVLDRIGARRASRRPA